MKNNKIITMVLLTVGCLAVFSSCKKQLETKVNSQLTPQNFYQSEGDANAALITLYIPFSSNWGNPDPGNGTWYAAFYNADIKTYLSKSLIGTDELYNEGTDGNTAPLFNFTWGSSSWTLSSGNEAVYSKITYVAKATEIIQAISNSNAVSESVKKSYVAQAKTLRAWLMYSLYDFYGPLNVKTDYATLTDTAATPRLSDAAYTAQIEKDITEALPDLADKYNSDATNWGRVSKGVARMILLRMYMNTKQWAKAQTVATDIIGMGYSLLTGPNGYASVFTNKSNNELIYAVPANSASPNFWAQEVFPTDFKSAPNIPARGVGWLTQYMPWAYYDKFEAGDLRKSTILDSYVTQGDVTKNRANGMKGAIPLKYTLIPNSTPDQPVDVVVFRYAEVLLSMAEALNEQGNTSNAYQYVNQVRERAGVSDFAAMSQAQLRAALLDERGRELFCEGVRRQDLIRNGTYISSAIARGKTNAQPFDVLFPIPNSVIVQGRGVILQNPGY
jgi:starch-binding outer membrane protein, SusD/RagB family